MSAISLHGVWQEYGDRVVIERLNLEIAAGSFLALVGPSGCGKTTLLRMLLGQERPSRGRILLDGKPMPAEPTADRGVVFQRYSVFPHLTALGNVLMALETARARVTGRLWGVARVQAKKRAADMLAEVGLAHAAQKYPAELSGGMQQRLALAQALIRHPRVLLLDEPFGALDAGIRGDVHALMNRLWRQEAMTVVMVTHDLPEAFRLATRVVVLERRDAAEQEPQRFGARPTYDIDLSARRAA